MSAITNMLSLVRQTYSRYEGSGAHIILSLASLLILFILYQRKKNKSDLCLILYCGVFLFIFACPVTAYIITRYGIEEGVYWRMLWLLPVTLLIAYTASVGVSAVSGRFAKIAAVMGVALLIAVSGQNMYREDLYQTADNAEHLPEDAREVCLAIREDASENHIENIKGLFDGHLVCYIRQYDGDIKMSFGRDVIRGLKQKDIYDALLDEETEAEDLLTLSREDSCSYIVLARGNRFDEGLLKNGCRLAAETANYRIYALES